MHIDIQHNGSVIMLSVVVVTNADCCILSAIMRNVVMLSVVVPTFIA